MSSAYGKHVGLGADGFGKSSMIGAAAAGVFIAEVVLTFLSAISPLSVMLLPALAVPSSDPSPAQPVQGRGLPSARDDDRTRQDERHDEDPQSDDGAESYGSHASSLSI